MPLVSIVLPTRNGEKYIRQSIESCLTQSFTDFELIVVDGASTDHTLDIVRAFDDPRIRIVDQPNNTGLLPGALNFGFANARGSFYTWTQDDDYFAPNALQILVDGLQANPEAGLVYAQIYFIDAEGNICREEPPRPPEDLWWTNPVGHCFMYRQSVAQQVGEYALDFYLSEDTQYWMRIYKQSKIVQLPGRYFYHRLHTGSLTLRKYGAYKALRIAARARREVLGLPWLKYREQVAAAYIEEAFAAHTLADHAHVVGCVARGLLNDPRWLANRGVGSIALKGLLQRSE